MKNKHINKNTKNNKNLKKELMKILLDLNIDLPEKECTLESLLMIDREVDKAIF